jgi:hypothetical protein
MVAMAERVAVPVLVATAVSAARATLRIRRVPMAVTAVVPAPGVAAAMVVVQVPGRVRLVRPVSVALTALPRLMAVMAVMVAPGSLRPRLVWQAVRVARAVPVVTRRGLARLVMVVPAARAVTVSLASMR